MISDKKEKLYINIVLALFIVGIICCFTLYPILCDTVSAEPLTENSVLNFNQLYGADIRTGTIGQSLTFTGQPITKVSGVYQDYSSNHVPYLSSPINIISGHSYYIYLNNSDSSVRNTIRNDTNETFILTGTHNYQDIYLASSNFTLSFGFFAYANVNYNYEVTIQLIDLTQCFGVGNEPTTVDEFRSYFVSDTYFYTSSSLISLGSLDSYNNGYSDALNQYSSSFKIKSTPMNTYMLLEKYDYGTSGEIVKEYGDLGGSDLGYGYYVVFDNTYGYLPFNISGGTDVTLKCEYISNLDTELTSADFPISLDFYYLVNSSLVNVYHKEFTNQSQLNAFHSFDFKVNIPIDVNGLYFKFGGKYLVYNLSAEYTSFDLNEFINTSISDAYQKGIDSVDIQSLKAQAFNQGKQAGIESANKYTFGTLFGSVIDAPIKAITGLLNFEVFGVNLKSFMLSLFTIGLVIAIVKLFLGNTGGGSNAK